MFYLFYRFIREDRNEIPPDLAVSLLEGFRDLLAIQVELPELESTESQDILREAVTAPSIFDSQLYLYEAAGTLISLLHKTPDQAAALLLSVIRPLLDELSASLRAVSGPDDVLAILKVHHIIMALGNIAKGFPEYPNPVPEGYVAPPLEVFREVGQAILVCLEAMNVFRVVRDAVRCVQWSAVCVLSNVPHPHRHALPSRGSLPRQDRPLPNSSRRSWRTFSRILSRQS